MSTTSTPITLGMPSTRTKVHSDIILHTVESLEEIQPNNLFLFKKRLCIYHLHVSSLTSDYNSHLTSTSQV